MKIFDEKGVAQPLLAGMQSQQNCNRCDSGQLQESYSFAGGHIQLTELSTAYFSVTRIEVRMQLPTTCLLLFENDVISLHYVLEGSVDILLKNMVWQKRIQGSLALLNDEKSKIKHSTGMSTTVHITFKKNVLTDLGALGREVRDVACNQDKLQHCVFRFDHTVRTLLLELFDSGKEISGNDLFLQSRICELFRLYRKQCSDSDTEDPILHPKLLQDIRLYLHQNLGLRITIAMLSKKFCINRTTLKRQFSQQFKQPIHKYLFHCRMDQAKYFLTHTNKGIGEITLLVGYCDFSSFSRAFSNYTGQSPYHYRKNMRPNC